MKVDGLLLKHNNINEIREKIFYLDQDVSLPELKIIDMLESLFQYKFNRKKSFNMTLIKELLKEFELKEDILNNNVSELSGGERQRLGIIVGLLLDRPIWLLDEPTSALDHKLKNKVVKNIIKLSHTIIVISHDKCWQDMDKIRLSK